MCVSEHKGHCSPSCSKPEENQQGQIASCHSKHLQGKLSTAITFMRGELSLLDQSLLHLWVCPKGLSSWSHDLASNHSSLEKNSHTHTHTYTPNPVQKRAWKREELISFLFISIFSQKSEGGHGESSDGFLCW